MKRKFLGLLITVLAIIGIFGFTACGSTPDSGKSDDDDTQTTASTKISLNKTMLTLEGGEAETLTATVSSTIADATVEWESSDSSVAAVEDGKITAVNAGKARITATADGKTVSCTVNVIEVTTLKELRCRASYYQGRNVWVKGVVTAEFNNTVYIEDYDEETGRYFGMPVYYGNTAGYNSYILNQLKIGNRVRVAGSLTEFEGSYRISGVSYNTLHPDDSKNTIVISQGHEGAFTETKAADIVSGKLDVNLGTKTLSLEYGDAATATTVTVSNLEVLRTATHPYSGEIKLECKADDDTTIIIRTTALKDGDGNVITGDNDGKTITIKGLVENYSYDDPFYEKRIRTYCVRCHLAEFITVL